MRILAIMHGVETEKGLERLEQAGCRLVGKASDGETTFAVLACREPCHGLTPRQVEVLQLVAGGISPAGIAEKLGISRKSVERHLRHCRQRLKAANDVQLGVVVERLGI